MNYNTTTKRLKLPEYGRNIQNMVDHCLTISDRDERNHCANTIIGVMGNMFPDLRDINDYKHILWDHLAIMADFKLDVDYPYDIPVKENVYRRPPKLYYRDGRMAFRHYGQLLEKLIYKVADMEDGPMKEDAILLIANQMKKSYLVWNKDSVDNGKILEDLAVLSEGRIVKYDDSFHLADAAFLLESAPKPNQDSGGSKKRKKKKK
ncbi:MAG: DUF4290 domain-containing protein [Tannerella sp.]|jgi:hypothetical protein|nr:DUF4290 domain-containing protein [Tannerella sp.]